VSSIGRGPFDTVFSSPNLHGIRTTNLFAISLKIGFLKKCLQHSCLVDVGLKRKQGMYNQQWKKDLETSGKLGFQNEYYFFDQYYQGSASLYCRGSAFGRWFVRYGIGDLPSAGRRHNPPLYYTEPANSTGNTEQTDFQSEWADCYPGETAFFERRM
jgi:hypothetical protein